MQLANKDIQKFQSIYRDKFGEDLEFSQAQEQAHQLINLMRAVYKPIPKNYYDNTQKQPTPNL